jgi:hypothetical protein
LFSAAGPDPFSLENWHVGEQKLDSVESKEAIPSKKSKKKEKKGVKAMLVCA